MTIEAGSTHDEFDVAIIGAGVIGLAVARAMALAGSSVLVLERHRTFGTGISSRNSEVIHAGIYYPAGSLKARLCVAGKEMLYEYCEDRGVPHRRCGKLLVASTPGETERLTTLAAQAQRNGVNDLTWLDQASLRKMEPELSVAAGILSPSSGIVDSHALMLSMIGDAESAGAVIVFDSPVTGGRVTSSGFVIETGVEERFEICSSQLINCTGLAAAVVAASVRGMADVCHPDVRLAKGNYFTLARQSPVSRLVYPLPVSGGLGIHVTLDMGGRARFGPDVEWIDEIDYAVSEDRAEAFYSAIRVYWPSITEGDLVPAYAGIRPKLAEPGCADADFLIQGVREHGIPGFVNLLGIESPGLTAALAIAEHVAGLCGVRGDARRRSALMRV